MARYQSIPAQPDAFARGGLKAGGFQELLDRMEPNAPIPRKTYSFGTLGKAQATRHMKSITEHHLRAAHVPSGTDQATTVNVITAAFTATSPSRRQPVTFEKHPERALH